MISDSSSASDAESGEKDCSLAVGSGNRSISSMEVKAAS